METETSARIGSKFHVVAVGDNPKTDVKEFGLSTKALFDIAHFLTEHSVRYVAMEATGGYKKPLVMALQQVSLNVLVTSGGHQPGTNVGSTGPPAQSDVSDAIHIRTRPQLGPLPPVFIIDEFATAIYPLVRMRQTMIEDAARRPTP